jgi:hypothetical protein
MWSVARHRAKKRRVPFDISPEDIVIPTRCPVLDIELRHGVGRTGRPGGNNESPSLDRIDKDKGYVKGNVQVISHLANSMKRDTSAAELQRFARWVEETYGR